MKHIIFCNCRGERISQDKLKIIESHLTGLTFRITMLIDLCGLAGMKDDSLVGVFDNQEQKLVIGCYPRAMKLLLHPAGVKNSDLPGSRFINLLETEASAAIEQINEFCGGQVSASSFREIREDSGWTSWFPVIDYSRCTTCGQCADFCLFGVYDKTDERVSVVNPKACKNNCPACARICPATAVIFPKYKFGGAIGGSGEIDEIAEHERQVQDIESILGNDIYSALQARKVKRESIIRQEALNKAISERDNALKESDRK